ncbi:efflux RND transporter periplasmic adaptor subunit [Halobacillus mangrovi]|uniref:efflux RND transporter periplasmic adaptor subunit n=1 Tax=Halobacillus mangrovi TaxID=402384 RepID=UPI003D9991F9
MKKKNYKGRIIGLVIIAFVTANAFLIYFDEDHEKVDRKSYVNEWSQAITYGLYETLDTEGVFASQESEEIYFSQEVGAFQEFLVEENQSVSEGDDLYTYEVLNYEQQESNLEGEITRLEEEITAAEDYIDEIENYEVPQPENDNSSSLFNNSDDTSDSSNSSEPPEYVETEFQKQSKLAEQEAELTKKEAMLEMAEDQLDQLQEEGQAITVTSSFSGTVTDISEELNAPLLTLKSTDLQIEGKFNEDERKMVEEDMAARIEVEDLNLKLEGTLSSIHSFPEEVEVHRSSYYPFEVNIDETEEQLLPGYHADVDIVTAEAIGAVTVMEDLLLTEKNLYAWVMNSEGQLERRAVTTGINDNGLIEVTEGLQEGEWLAYKPKDEFRRQVPFITPIKLRDLDFQDIIDVDQDTLTTYGLLGLLAR